MITKTRNQTLFVFSHLRSGYRNGDFTVSDILDESLRRINAVSQKVFIHLADSETLFREAERLQALMASHPDPWSHWPLLGMPFAVKDNLDVAGMPTSAACPALAKKAQQSAVTVQRILNAGGLCLGKTNMDQLATGLVGVRSPYGICHNAFNADYIAGGSSSGSGLAVSLGFCAFALGTDTAGSGRVPAAYGNTVGLKPTRGLLSARGLLPACPSLDCVSIFTLLADDASEVLAVTSAFDSEDPWSRPKPQATENNVTKATSNAAKPWQGLRLGIPHPGQLDFSDDKDYAKCYDAAVELAQSLGARCLGYDLGPLLEAAQLLYQGPWIAERYASIAENIAPDSADLLPVLREILSSGSQRNAIEVFRAQQRLQVLRRASEKIFSACDILLLPTVPTLFTLAQIAAEPIKRNSELGRFTNFVNLLDLAAIAVPAAFTAKDLPFGVTLIAPAFQDDALLQLASAWQRATGLGLGAGQWQIPEPLLPAAHLKTYNPNVTVSSMVPLLVFGLHLQGQPLAPEMENLEAIWVGETRTAPGYAMHLIVKGDRRLPGVLRAHGAAGNLLGEIWNVPSPALGSFIQGIKAPLSLGWIELADGGSILGFLTEADAIKESLDITALGGWKAYLQV
jgi:allophanate hydrolase